MRQQLPRVLLLALGCLLLLNLFQAYFTGLLYDEAYYWYYAQNPAWGYFDHPPMVAWMIWAGIQVFPGELGVRLLSCLAGTGTLLLLWQLADHPSKNKNPWPLLLWLVSIVLMHAYGFLSLPDTPLLFFTALFLWTYRRFLQAPSRWFLLLGLVMAALMYSKYHAALVILFTLASNPRLLRNPWAWAAVGISLAAYAPHLYWLFDHDFVSVRYHLFERPNQPYNFAKFTAGYFVNLLALFGLTFPWVYLALFRFRPANRFEKALQYLAWGVLLFFLVSSFQRRVQTQWLIVTCIPLALIVGQALARQPVWSKWVTRAAIANLLVLAWLRLGLAYPPLFPVYFEAHGNKAWVMRLSEVAGDAEVVFENSYRLASMYGFYSGRPSFSLNNVYYRKNQYSIDGSEAAMQGRKVLFIPKVATSGERSYTDARGRLRYGNIIDPFTSYRQLKAEVLTEPSATPDGTFTFSLTNPYPEPVPLDSLRFGIAQLDAYKEVQKVQPITPESPIPTGLLNPGDTLQFPFRKPESGQDTRYLRAVVSKKGFNWGLNGIPQKIDQ